MRIREVLLFLGLIYWAALMNAQDVDLCEGQDWFSHMKVSPTQLCKGVLEAAFNNRANAISDLQRVIEKDPKGPESYRAHEVLLEMDFRQGRYRDAFSQADTMLALRPGATDITDLRPLLSALSSYPNFTIHRKRSILPYIPTSDENPHFPVRAEDREGLFYADTGANISVMSDAEAHALGLAIRSVESKMGDISGSSISLRVADVNTLRVGKSTLRHVAFVIVPASQPPFNEVPIHQQAILGIQVLLALKRIQVSEDGRTELAGPRKSVGGFTSIAFDQSQPVIQMDFDGKPMLYTMDTGAIHTTLNPRFGETFPTEIHRGKAEDHKLTGVGGDTSQPSISLDRLRFTLAGNEVVLFPAVVLLKKTTAESSWAAGNLGYDLIKQTAPFMIDFEQMTFRSERGLPTR
jgi:hypothetical protein